MPVHCEFAPSWCAFEEVRKPVNCFAIGYRSGRISARLGGRTMTTMMTATTASWSLATGLGLVRSILKHQELPRRHRLTYVLFLFPSAWWYLTCRSCDKYGQPILTAGYTGKGEEQCNSGSVNVEVKAKPGSPHRQRGFQTQETTGSLRHSRIRPRGCHSDSITPAPDTASHAQDGASQSINDTACPP
ncbi:hypothetical protein GE09DRAFT_360745 [Coniochaeta sp. 2T2.1]|nr:hypothetical protein GE09DRAFT_360745 [Coniochaeta sp. 2T2.1]